ncbi:chorismate-binding protein [uncultured Algibacter sp.]|uniref:chorismate-binding protein n=1 Tax=uncultured Algibacter sp. TaxID=298659 RepID=UPI0026345D9A|nr:chorismate-binding protein [uncultured Algibacter sp.]
MTSNDFFERIEAHFINQLPFVAYRKPNREVVTAMLQRHNDLIFTKNFTEKGFVFSPFDAIEKTVLLPDNTSEIISCSQFSVIPAQAGTHLENDSALTASKDFHINLVKQGVEAINTSDLKKVVLSRQETISLSEENPIEIFKGLLAAYKSAFVYCWYHPKVGLWLGATPETLIKIEGNRFSIMALAGTQDYKGNLDVVWQNKEQQEQQFVTDFIVDNLKPSVESFKVSDVETVKAGNLVHLKTMISAQLKKETPLKNIIEALHPTPAVCGLPKQLAKQFILKHENYNREFYTGFLGELNGETTIAPRSSKRNIENRAYSVKRNSTQLYVNLRCMQLKNKQALIYVGGGITESSDAEKEWEETVSKTKIIKKVL